MVILSKIRNHPDLMYSELNKGEDKDETFKRVAIEVLKREIAVHKTGGRDKSDLDGETALYLWRKALGPEIDIEYVAPGKKVKGKTNIDTSEADGVGVFPSDEGDWIGDIQHIDHHGKMSVSDTSAADLTYEFLINLGLLKREGSIELNVGLTFRKKHSAFC